VSAAMLHPAMLHVVCDWSGSGSWALSGVVDVTEWKHPLPRAQK
jgi:hypothetical protein